MSTNSALPDAYADDAPISDVRDSLSDVWVDRDLSWLEFNRRVLAAAIDERTPLLEHGCNQDDRVPSGR